jgi:UDP-2-acetamido-3-amino-2,3-dideoxy-glucuronate N-acetyltransferase
MPYFHPLSSVQSNQIGSGTRIWQFCVVLPEAKIGTDCNICAHVFIENDVVIGDRVTVKCGVQIWDGLRIADDVFIGPNVTFTNDPFPRSQNRPEAYSVTTIHKGASIGANATILPGVSIGAGAMIGAGSLVTKDVPAHEVWIGSPARFHRAIC